MPKKLRDLWERLRDAVVPLSDEEVLEQLVDKTPRKHCGGPCCPPPNYDNPGCCCICPCLTCQPTEKDFERAIRVANTFGSDGFVETLRKARSKRIESWRDRLPEEI